MQTPPTAPAKPERDSTSGSGTTASKKSTQEAPVHRPPEEDATEFWSYELFGCLSDWRICCATFLCPCYTVGRNAAYFGDEGALSGLLYCVGLVAVGPMLRWRIRQHRHLHGSMLSDALVHCFCPCCALIQENRELYGFEGSHVGEQIPLQVEISRQ